MGEYYLYTDEEKQSYKKFFQKTHSMSDSDLFRVNNNLCSDKLKSELKDIVAWEIRIRELNALKRAGIKPEEEYSWKNDEKHRFFIDLENNKKFGSIEYDKDTIDPETGLSMSKAAALERVASEGMTQELLENTIKIIENNPVVYDLSDPTTKAKFHNKDGGGMNIMTKKILVKCENGDKYLFDNQNIQEHFRKEYVKRMSEVCGFDFTQYDLRSNSELFNIRESNMEIPDNTDIEIMDNPVPNFFGNDDDFEDD